MDKLWHDWSYKLSPPEKAICDQKGWWFFVTLRRGDVETFCDICHNFIEDFPKSYVISTVNIDWVPNTPPHNWAELEMMSMNVIANDFKECNLFLFGEQVQCLNVF